MSTSRLHDRSQIASGAPDERQAVEVSRRTMLAGAVATAAAVGASDMPAYARGANPDSSEHMMAFLVLSSALTGIHVINLAPEFSQADPKDSKKTLPILQADPGTDPINVKNDYFKWINASNASTFEKLLQIAREHSTSAPDAIGSGIIAEVNANDDTKYMARSIALLWYLGSWYKPEDLKKKSRSQSCPRTDQLRGGIGESLYAGPGLADRAGPSDGLQQSSIRLLVAGPGRFKRQEPSP